MSTDMSGEHDTTSVLPEQAEQAEQAESPASPERPSGRHPVSIGHLVMGIAFLGLAVVAGLVTGDVVDGDDVHFLMPLPWVLAGLGGLAALVLRDRGRYGSRMQGWVEPPAAPTAPAVDLDKQD